MLPNDDSKACANLQSAPCASSPVADEVDGGDGSLLSKLDDCPANCTRCAVLDDGCSAWRDRDEILEHPQCRTRVHSKLRGILVVELLRALRQLVLLSKEMTRPLACDVCKLTSRSAKQK